MTSAKLIATCEQQDVVTIEPTAEAEEDWLTVLYGGNLQGVGTYFASCTPGYYNSEGAAPDARAARNLGFPGNLIEYDDVIGHREHTGGLYQ